jgi:hypothetical protein
MSTRLLNLLEQLVKTVKRVQVSAVLLSMSQSLSQYEQLQTCNIHKQPTCREQHHRCVCITILRQDVPYELDYAALYRLMSFG